MPKRIEQDDVAVYEHLFRDCKPDGSQKNRLFGAILRKNFWPLVWSSLVYIVKASPWWVISIVTANVINLVTQYLGGEITSDAAIRDILINAAVFTVMLVQNIPTHMLWAKICSKIYRDNSASVRCAAIRKLQRLSITYHKEMETGAVQSKFLRDVEGTDNLVANTTNVLLPAVLGVLISVGISIVKSGTVTLFFVGIVPLNVLLAVFFRKKMRESSHLLRKDNERVANRLSTMMEMLLVTKAHGLEEHEYESFRRDINKLKDSGKQLDMVTARFSSTSWVVSNLLSGVCLLFCAYLAYIGQIGVGDIVLYQSLFSNINTNVLQFINALPAIAQGLESVRSISELMNAGDMEETHPSDLPPIRGEVEFSHVSYRYPDSDAHVVEDFSCKVHPGECVAVVGASGSGKSTLMNMIIGFLKPTEGTVSIDGISMSEIDLTKYRQSLSVVPQNSILFSGTIRENITYGMDRYSEEELQKVLEVANVNEFLGELPEGIDTPIGEHGGRLSGGQKQRISIARALIRDPRILILDEATSALDNVSEYHVQKAISGLIRGRTTFIVAHRLSTIRDADRIFVLDKGKCVESGTYEELMQRGGKFYELKTLSDITYKTAEEALS